MCPFVNSDDRRCSTHLTLENIAIALAHCANRYTDCPIFHELLAEERAHAPQQVPDTAAAS
ncbi:MAG: hypothetical protein KAX78_09695 [Phycisphaerae bacterium]|nr:hypothetical protein [Phycisphaerae bacterium]